jgi:hypothetical protein
MLFNQKPDNEASMAKEIDLLQEITASRYRGIQDLMGLESVRAREAYGRLLAFQDEIDSLSAERERFEWSFPGYRPGLDRRVNELDSRIFSLKKLMWDEPNQTWKDLIPMRTERRKRMEELEALEFLMD